MATSGSSASLSGGAQGQALSTNDAPARVCPRCGVAKGASRWCSGCGLNLELAGELPTNEEYAAAQREKQWLAQQAKREASAAVAIELAERLRVVQEAEDAEKKTQVAEAKQQAQRARGEAQLFPTGRGQEEGPREAKHDRPTPRRRPSIILATVIAVFAGAVAGVVFVTHSGSRSRRSEAVTLTTQGSSTPQPSSQTSLFAAPFQAPLTGTVTQTRLRNGVRVNLYLRLSGPGERRLDAVLDGASLGGGGLSLTGSRVTLGTASNSSLYVGQMISVVGQQFIARVTRSDGVFLSLDAHLSINSNTGTVSGTLDATAG